MSVSRILDKYKRTKRSSSICSVNIATITASSRWVWGDTHSHIESKKMTIIPYTLSNIMLVNPSMDLSVSFAKSHLAFAASINLPLFIIVYLLRWQCVLVEMIHAKTCTETRTRYSCVWICICARCRGTQFDLNVDFLFRYDYIDVNTIFGLFIYLLFTSLSSCIGWYSSKWMDMNPWREIWRGTRRFMIFYFAWRTGAAVPRTSAVN